VGPGASLDAVAKRKNFCLCQELNPGCSDILTELLHLLLGWKETNFFYFQATTTCILECNQL
jgi:hypothetical protein